MKKVLATVCLLLSTTIALSACSTTGSDVQGADKVFEKKVTK